MKFEIKRLTGEVRFRGEAESLRTFVEELVESGADLNGADLNGADLNDAKLRGANLNSACLQGANLYAADLSFANLRDADLCGANLNGANLKGAHLNGANLRCAYLGGANLNGANLSGAYLGGASLLGVEDVIHAGHPDGFWCFGWHKDSVIMVQVGCRNFTLEEGREYWKNKPDRREVLAALDYIEAVAKIRGWPIAHRTWRLAL